MFLADVDVITFKIVTHWASQLTLFYIFFPTQVAKDFLELNLLKPRLPRFQDVKKNHFSLDFGCVDGLVMCGM